MIRTLSSRGNVTALVVGLGLGALMFGSRSEPLRAGGGDRPDSAIVTTGPISIEATKGKVQISSDAVYYLNYSRGRLYAAVPMLTATAGSTSLLSAFAERDLVKDFQIAPGTNPHFTMTTGSLGANSEGWAPLYVFETTTGRMIAYRTLPQSTVVSNQPDIKPVEVRNDARLGRARPAAQVTDRR